MSFQQEIVSKQNIEELSEYVISLLQKECAQKATNEYVSVALSGGSTPKRIFEYISKHDAGRVDWSKIKFFWGDERCVPPEDNESNFKMTKLNLFDRISIPAENIFRVLGEAKPEDEAIRYGQLITEQVKIENNLPSFDIMMLGLGEDGHTASMFQGNTELFQSQEICGVATHPVSGQKRITMTMHILNNSKNILFLVTGIDKAKIAADVVNNKNTIYPASMVAPLNGTLTWLMDTAAAGLL